MSQKPVAILALELPIRSKASNYPEPFRSMMQGRMKRSLGDAFGLSNFGVNMTILLPQAVSALRHAHTKQDEFIYVLAGTLTLQTDEGDTILKEGMCAGFKAGSGNAHRLINLSSEEAVYLEIGDRTSGDAASYPDEDLVAKQENGAWVFTHKDGSPYT